MMWSHQIGVKTQLRTNTVLTWLNSRTRPPFLEGAVSPCCSVAMQSSRFYSMWIVCAIEWKTLLFWDTWLKFLLWSHSTDVDGMLYHCIILLKFLTGGCDLNIFYLFDASFRFRFQFTCRCCPESSPLLSPLYKLCHYEHHFWLGAYQVTIWKAMLFIHEVLYANV